MWGRDEQPQIMENNTAKLIEEFSSIRTIYSVKINWVKWLAWY